ncbi:MAG: queuosine precursor transporter [Anaerolineales bacterium]
MGRWYPAVVALLVTSLVVSNIIAVRLIAVRLSDSIELTLPAAIVLFPVAYIVGDVLTEVYGYSAARRAIWIAFGCNLLAVIAIWLAGVLPSAAFWTAGVYENPEQADQAYRAILGFTPRLLVASFLAYLVGEFLNSFVLAKMKLRTEGRYLWMRTIGSTLVGQGADSLIFITVAFFGILPPPALMTAIFSQWLVKSVYEALATPITYWVINALKRSEGINTFDRNTDFRPVRL